MGKDPAFLFYPGDWQGGTLTLSRFLKGCYIDVLIAQFNNGHLSLEEIKTVLGSDFGQAWPTIQKKFKKDSNDLFFNEKLETEMIKRKEYSLSRSNNRRKKDMINISNTHDKTYVNHMEIENEIEVASIDFINKNELQQKIEDAIFSDEIFVDKLRSTHRDKDLKQAFFECYIHHSNGPNPPQQLWQWRQKLNSWLTIKPQEKTKPNKNGVSKDKLEQFRKR